MMGIAVPDLEQPILKNTNAVLAMSEADAVLPEPTACIRCGRCIRHCPLRLMPSHIVAAYEAGDMERLAELKVNLCMECGCCSFICPAHRPLVQTNKLAKAQVAAWRKLQSEKSSTQRRRPCKMKLVISASPHIDSGATTRKIMRDVLIALCPALIAAAIIFGCARCW